MSNDNLYCSFTITYVMLNKSIGKFNIYKSYKKNYNGAKTIHDIIKFSIYSKGGNFQIQISD